MTSSKPGNLPAPLSLERLPLHILELIVEVLVANDTSKRCSLYALSLASRTCYDATERQRFSYICFTVNSEAELRRDVLEWGKLLQVKGRLRLVRILKIQGFMNSLEDPDESSNKQEEMPVSDESYSNSTENEQSSFDPCTPPDKSIRILLGETSQDPFEIRRHFKAWEPLATLISSLSGLTDLVHACADQLCRSILEALHQHRPTCRLHMHTFALRSFLRAPNDDRPIDPNDVQLLTSPCLYSISTPGKDWYRWGKLDNAPHLQTKRINYNLVLIPKMVAGLSSNLAKVAICPDWMRRWNERSSNYQTPWPPMESFFNMSKDAPSFKFGGQLQTLSLPSFHTWPGTSRDYLERFRAESINWSKLDSLTIKGYAGSLTLKYLAEMGNDGELLSLMSLSLDISGGIQNFDDIDEKNSLMIRSLSPLQELNLTGWLGNATYSAVLDCGISLRKLTFLPVTRCIEVSDKQFLSLMPNHVHALRQRLTKLEELTVRICHVEGTESQVETYRIDHV